MFTGMASPATTSSDFNTQAEGDCDYGSDFSAEEEEIVNRLLVEIEVIEDNPIVTDLEYHDPTQTVRVPQVIGRERINGLLEESNIAKDDRLSSAAVQSDHWDCEPLPSILCVETTLTDAEASSEPS